MKPSVKMSLPLLLSLGCWACTALRFDGPRALYGSSTPNRVWVAVPSKNTVQRDGSDYQGFGISPVKTDYNCDAQICDKMLRHAHELSRLKLIRRYVRDTVSTLDRLVTALDAELIASGESLKRAFGSTCPVIKAVLSDVTEASFETLESR